MQLGSLNEISLLNMQEIAEIYEQEQNLEHVIHYYDKAADLFQSEEVQLLQISASRKLLNMLLNWKVSLSQHGHISRGYFYF